MNTNKKIILWTMLLLSVFTFNSCTKKENSILTKEEKDKGFKEYKGIKYGDGIILTLPFEAKDYFELGSDYTTYPILNDTFLSDDSFDYEYDDNGNIFPTKNYWLCNIFKSFQDNNERKFQKGDKISDFQLNFIRIIVDKSTSQIYSVESNINDLVKLSTNYEFIEYAQQFLGDDFTKGNIEHRTSVNSKNMPPYNWTEYKTLDGKISCTYTETIAEDNEHENKYSISIEKHL